MAGSTLITSFHVAAVDNHSIYPKAEVPHTPVSRSAIIFNPNSADMSWFIEREVKDIFFLVRGGDVPTPHHTFREGG